MENLGLVIPLYNESACLPGLIAELDEVIAKIDANITVYMMNDGSKDNTGELLEQFASKRNWLCVVNKTNSGHGPTIYLGYKKAIEANSDWIFQCDSDQQIPLKELISLWQQRKTNTTVLGVRAQRQDPSERLFVSSLLRLALRVLFNVSIRDANCPFRLFPASALKAFLQHIPADTFAPNVFISVMAKSSMPVQETYVSHLPRMSGTNSINRINLLKVCLRCAGQLMNFWRSKESWPKLQNAHHSSL